MKNIKFVVVFVFYTFFITISFAQTSINRYGGLYLFQEFRFQNFSNINNALQNYGFNSSANLGYSSGAGGYGWFGKFKVGGEGTYFRNKNEANNNNQATQLQGFGGNFYTAYLINPTSKIQVLPLIAVGGESMTLSANQENSITDFSEALQNPQTVQLKTGNFYLKTALQLEYKAQKSVMGFQIGYYYSPNQKWQLNTQSLFDAPSDRLSNFFLRFTFGLE